MWTAMTSAPALFPPPPYPEPSSLRDYLVVDDNRALAENLAEIIECEGHASVQIALSGAAALRLVRVTRFDGIVSDMRMPLMGGAELIHRARLLDPELPVIIISAYTSDADLDAVRREGPIAILPKPVPVERLLRLLAGARRVARTDRDGGEVDRSFSC